MSTVWLAEKGSYSDRYVVGVFESKEAADAALPNVDEVDLTEIAFNVILHDESPVWMAQILNEEIEVYHRMVLENDRDAYAYWNDREGWWGVGYGTTPELAQKNLADAWAEAKAERANI